MEYKINKINEQTSQNKNKHIPRIERWLPEGKGGGGKRVKWVKGVSCMVTDRNETLGGQRAAVLYTEVKLYLCTYEIYIML